MNYFVQKSNRFQRNRQEQVVINKNSTSKQGAGNDDAVFKSFIVADADKVAGRTEGRPRDVEPSGAGQELVGKLTCL